MSHGPWQFVILALVILFPLILKRFGGRAAGSALVVKEVHVDESNECQVKVVARKSGLWSFLMSFIGVDSTFTLLVFRDRLESMEGSLSGRIKTVIPLTALDTYTTGFTKPIYLLVLAVIFIIVALYGSFMKMPGLAVFFLVTLAILCCIFFYLRKCLLLSFTTNGANGIYFLFKRSVIEGVNVDETLSEQIGDLVKRNYLNQVRK